MKHCAQCKNLMPNEVTRFIRCGHDSSKDLPPVAISAATPRSIEKQPGSKPSSVNWLRVCAIVFTSKLFFVASCTAGLVISAPFFGGSGDYGPEVTESRRPPSLTSVIATIPDAEKHGQRTPVVVFLSGLDEFKAKNPDYSFLLPPGKGQVDNPAAEMLTMYSVTASEPGKVIVESHFHHDVPPTNLDVRQRYEATDKSVRILNAKVGSDLGRGWLLGLGLATILAFTGSILKKRFEPTKPPLSAADLAASKTAATKRTLKILAVAIGLVLAYIFSALMIFFFFGLPN